MNEKCNRCHGTGKIKVVDLYPMNPERIEPCPDCDGTGRGALHIDKAGWDILLTANGKLLKEYVK